MKAISELRRWWAVPWVRLAIAALAFGAVTVATIAIGRYQMFTILQPYEDEGYMLVALKNFVNHGSLYNYVFTQYGPFFYSFWGGIFSAFGITVDETSGRIATMTVWIAVSLGLGLVTMRLARSLLLGLAVQMLAFTALLVFINEPMHAGGLICLLLVAILAAACFMRERPSPYPAALLGAAVAALIGVKINVGAFALISLALVCVVSYPLLSGRRWVRAPLELLFVVLPFLLMSSDLGESWASHYAIHVSVAALGVVIVLRARELAARADEELRWMLGGLLVLGVVTCIAVLGSGTSIGGLIEGTITQPLKQSDAFTIALGLSNWTYLFDALALAGACGYLVVRRRGLTLGPAWIGLGSVLAIGLGVEMMLSVTARSFPWEATTMPGYLFAYLGFAWVALLPEVEERPAVGFARLLLPALAVLQAMHAYPVAGSQSYWSTFLLAAVGAVILGDGVRRLVALRFEGNQRYALGAAVLVIGAIGVAFLARETLKEPLRGSRALYLSRELLDLPGSGRIRLAPEEVDRYRAITEAIKADCASLLELPGMGNFYIWAEQEPPTGYVATAWPTLFDDAHQEKVVEQTRDIPNLCLLRNTSLAEGWSGGEIPRGPLVVYLEEGFEPIFSREGYELLRREEPAG